jgi:hypothetical protein
MRISNVQWQKNYSGCSLVVKNAGNQNTQPSSVCFRKMERVRTLGRFFRFFLKHVEMTAAGMHAVTRFIILKNFTPQLYIFVLNCAKMFFPDIKMAMAFLAKP